MMEEYGEDFDARVCTLDDGTMNADLGDARLTGNVPGFIAWGDGRVYFSLMAEGRGPEVGSAPRNPCDEDTE